MYTKLHFKNNEKEITFELHEIYWLIEVATKDFLMTPVLPQTKEVTRLDRREEFY